MKSNRKAGPAGRRERRAFSDEFKAEAVRLVAERRAAGVPLTQVGRELDVRPDQLRRWSQESRRERDGESALPGESLEQENRRLRREVAVLRQEQAFAKKVAADSTGQCNTSLIAQTDRRWIDGTDRTTGTVSGQEGRALETVSRG